MKAMVLAAGRGTRLRPLTDRLPKALVEVGGRSLLEITLERLKSFGIKEVIVNVHHLADQIIDYLGEHGQFGMRVEVSREPVLLDTGGGLKKAAWFFLEDQKSKDEPFLLHNVDVISTIDFARLFHARKEKRALATLAVRRRETSRYLLFDGQMELCGRKITSSSEEEVVRRSDALEPLAFSGVHAISPRLFELLTEEGAFSIIAAYLRLAAEGETISGFRADESYWRDLGKPGELLEASRDFEQKLFS